MFNQTDGDNSAIDIEDHELENSEEENSEEYLNETYSPGDDHAGTYNMTVKAENTGNGEEYAFAENFTVDNEAPEISIEEPSDNYLDDGDFDIEATFTDELSKLQNATLEFLDDGDREDIVYLDENDTEEETLELDVDLSDGDDYKIYANATDMVGNNDSESEEFTVTEDLEASTSVDLDPEGGLFTVEEFEDDYNEQVEITVDEEEDAVTDKEIACYDDSSGDQLDSDGDEDIQNSDGEFECEIDMGDYGGSTVDFYVEICDMAGNCDETSIEEYSFDEDPPEVFDLDSSTGHDIFNDDFEAEFESFDDVSGTERAEYFFSLSNEGDGEQFSADEGENSFTVETSDLDTGENTLYLRTRDEVDRWGDSETFEFEYLPDESPEIEIETSQNISVTSGESKNFQITVRNVGDIIVQESVFEAVSEGVVDEEEELPEIGVNDSTTFDITFDTEEEDLGEHQLEMSTDNPSKTVEIPLYVTANEEQRQEIDGYFSEYDNELNALEENITDLKDQGLSEEREQELESTFTNLEQQLNEIEQSIESGEYYNVDGSVASLGSELDSAQVEFTEIEEQHYSDRRTRRVIALFAFMFLGSLGAVGFFAYSEDYDLDVNKYYDSDIDIPTPEDIVVKIESIIKDEEEAEQFEWDGFKR